MKKQSTEKLSKIGIPKNSKKGMEMTMSTIVTVIILLIVLGVVIFIFAKGMGQSDSAIGNYFTKLNQSRETNDPSSVLGEGWQNTGQGNFILPLLPLPLLKFKKKKEI